MRWTQAILHVQETEKDIASVLRRLDEIEVLLGDRAALEQAEADLEQKSAQVAEIRKVQKELEFELGKVQAKLQRTQKRLYGGTVTNSRELEDLQAEAQSLQRRQSTLEDDLLEVMIEREEAEEAEQAAQAHLAQAQETWENKHRDLVAEREQLHARIETLRADLEQLKTQVPADILDTYEYLKDRTNNLPVARLNGDVCGVCGTLIRRPTQRKVSAEEEAYCDNCRRMLVP